MTKRPEFLYSLPTKIMEIADSPYPQVQSHHDTLTLHLNRKTKSSDQMHTHSSGRLVWETTP